ncbi:unnamed protein product [Lactuca saligna]|uniref:DYW domain-containing protein n=1 Tax=Lactuca saligna TaxID=75948 RepID=A0AA36A2B3_LACSI|nr:unnamed protein product [Lactuca saligna]
MSQARARSFEMVKSLNYLYKVCNCTSASRSYFSVSFFKALSFVKSFSTLNSAATDESFHFRNPNEFPANVKNNYWSIRDSNNQFDQNPDGVYRKNPLVVQKKPTVAYGQSYNCDRNYENKILEQSSNTLYEEGRNVQSSYWMNSGVSKEVIGGGNDEYPKYNGHFQGNQGNHNMGKDGIHRQSQYNINGSYGGNASSNQQSSGLVNYEVPIDSQPKEKLYKPGEEKQLLGTIEELNAFCKEQKLKEAVEVLRMLELKKVTVEMPGYLFLMKACGETQALKEAKQVHNHLTRSVHHLDVHICNKILEMYSKCGSMEDAYKVFDKMPQRNLTSWDTMITWLAKNGHGEDALEMFTEFKKVGLKPDNQMFDGVFAACSVVGDMKEGLLHFESMTKNYNLVLSIDDYASVVDMLGSSGYLNEALEFIEKMPMNPNVEIWEIMMNQSRVYGDLELEDRCAEIVNLLDPSHLDKKSEKGLIPIKPLDIAKEKNKSAPLNLLEIKAKTFQFRAGDTSQADHEKLYSQLRCLKQHMIEVGYVAQTRFVLHDLDHESREEALLSHSERLALSQALLNSPPRATIRIMKNLRVCGDCHEALKIISKLVGRLIVARDAKRFHHFQNGVCSCKDYW